MLVAPVSDCVCCQSKTCLKADCCRLDCVSLRLDCVSLIWSEPEPGCFRKQILSFVYFTHTCKLSIARKCTLRNGKSRPPIVPSKYHFGHLWNSRLRLDCQWAIQKKSRNCSKRQSQEHEAKNLLLDPQNSHPNPNHHSWWQNDKITLISNSCLTCVSALSSRWKAWMDTSRLVICQYDSRQRHNFSIQTTKRGCISFFKFLFSGHGNGWPCELLYFCFCTFQCQYSIQSPSRL